MEIIIKENFESPEIGICNKGDKKDISVETANRLIQRGLAEEIKSEIKKPVVKAKTEDK